MHHHHRSESKHNNTKTTTTNEKFDGWRTADLSRLADEALAVQNAQLCLCGTEHNSQMAFHDSIKKSRAVLTAAKTCEQPAKKHRERRRSQDRNLLEEKEEIKITPPQERNYIAPTTTTLKDVKLPSLLFSATDESSEEKGKVRKERRRRKHWCELHARLHRCGHAPNANERRMPTNVENKKIQVDALLQTTDEEAAIKNYEQKQLQNYIQKFLPSDHAQNNATTSKADVRKCVQPTQSTLANRAEMPKMSKTNLLKLQKHAATCVAAHKKHQHRAISRQVSTFDFKNMQHVANELPANTQNYYEAVSKKLMPIPEHAYESIDKNKQMQNNMERCQKFIDFIEVQQDALQKQMEAVTKTHVPQHVAATSDSQQNARVAAATILPLKSTNAKAETSEPKRKLSHAYCRACHKNLRCKAVEKQRFLQQHAQRNAQIQKCQKLMLKSLHTLGQITKQQQQDWKNYFDEVASEHQVKPIMTCDKSLQTDDLPLWEQYLEAVTQTAAEAAENEHSTISSNISEPKSLSSNVTAASTNQPNGIYIPPLDLGSLANSSETDPEFCQYEKEQHSDEVMQQHHKQQQHSPQCSHWQQYQPQQQHSSEHLKQYEMQHSHQYQHEQQQQHSCCQTMQHQKQHYQQHEHCSREYMQHQYETKQQNQNNCPVFMQNQQQYQKNESQQKHNSREFMQQQHKHEQKQQLEKKSSTQDFLEYLQKQQQEKEQTKKENLSTNCLWKTIIESELRLYRNSEDKA